jgi:YD repeat-containing protein
MKNFTRIFLLAATILLVFVSAPAQDPNSFASGIGGFGIDLPKTGVSVKELPAAGGGLKSYGRSYSWPGAGRYGCTIAYRKFKTDKPLTPAQKTAILNAARKSYLGYPPAKGFSYISKPYDFHGSKGIELRISNPEGGSIVRLFTTAKRLYEVRAFPGKQKDIAGALKLMDSFRLLAADELMAAKVEEAAQPLPQVPPADKPKSDAEDNSLKGKVKSVLTDGFDVKQNRRWRAGEQHYDERGNLLKEIDFYDGYPSSVTMWGYIDGRRASKAVKIEFEDDQDQPYEHTYLRNRLSESEEEKDPGIRKDTRFTNRYEYKYDALGRMTERRVYRNSGKLEILSVFEYKDNRIAMISFDDESKKTPVDVVVGETDAAGNMISFAALDGAGIPHYYTTYTYEFDPRGNWVVKRSFKPDTVDDKDVTVLKNIEYRTIAYY